MCTRVVWETIETLSILTHANSLALSCSIFECFAACCRVLQSVAECCSVLLYIAECCRVLQCVAACCSVLQCLAVCCSVPEGREDKDDCEDKDGEVLFGACFTCAV